MLLSKNLSNVVDDAVRIGDFDRSIEIPGTDISLRLGYEHRWVETLRSTAMVSWAEQERDLLPESLRRVASATFNLIWNPLPGFGVGAEFLHGTQETQGGVERDEDQFFLAIQLGF